MKKLKPKQILIIAVAVVVFAALMGILFGKKTDPEGESKAESTAAKTTLAAESTEPSTAEASTTLAEANTSARVDQILLQAKHDAENVSESEEEQKWKDAFEYLKSHMDNFYENNEVMEKSMYYGEYIYQYIEANSPAQNVSQLQDSTRAAYDAGYNTVKAIKYVYRGADKIEDDSTQNALAEAKKNLEKFKLE